MQKKITVDYNSYLSKAHVSPVISTKNTAKTHLFFPKKILQNKLFQPQNRKISKPLKAWINKLRNKFRFESPTEINLKSANKLNSIFDDAIFIFMSLNYIKYAREICYSQINIFMDWNDKTHNHLFLPYVFQAWMNLIRIDRVTGNINKAVKKLNILTHINDEKFTSKDNHSLVKLLQKNHELKMSISRQSLREQVKLYLHTHYYRELIHLLELKNNLVDLVDIWEKQEALAIALANQNRLEDALHVLKFAKDCSASLFSYVFYLRECEIQLFFTKKPRHRNELRNLFHTAFNFLQHHPVSVDTIRIGLRAADLLAAGDKIDETIKLIYFCLERADYIEDEVLKADCLVRLYELIADAEGKRLIENLMINHYYRTDYVSARHNMLNAFHDLKYVENKPYQVEMTSLFEDLLQLSKMSSNTNNSNNIPKSTAICAELAR